MRAQFGRQHVRADVLQQTPLGNDVANVRNVVESDCSRRENSRGHAGQGRVLRAADRNAAFDGVAAANTKFVHGERLKEKTRNREWGEREILWNSSPALDRLSYLRGHVICAHLVGDLDANVGQRVLGMSLAIKLFGTGRIEG